MFENSNMDSQKKFLPKLYPGDKNINRTWFVAYTAKDGRQKKVYGKLNHLATVEERLYEAQLIIQSIYLEDDILPETTIGNQLIIDLEEVFNIRKQGWKPKSQSAYFTHLTQFALWFRGAGCPPFDSLQANKFLNSISDKGRSSTTRNIYRNNLKSLFIDLNRFFKGKYPDNPFMAIRKLPEARKTKEWFRPAHVKQLKEYINDKDPWLWLACRIMYHCFTRPNELRQLTVGDINFDIKKIRVVSSVAKTSRTRFVPIPDILFNDLIFLKQYPANNCIFGYAGTPGMDPVSRDNMSKRHELVMRLLEYPKGFTFYSWKNTGAVKMLIMDKKPMRYVSKCMGHQSMDMTDKYFESLGVDEMGDSILFPEI